MPEIIVVPDVPDAARLLQGLATREGQATIINDIYHDMQNTAQSLRDHVSSNGITHDMNDQMVAAMSLDLKQVRAEMAVLQASFASAIDTISGLTDTITTLNAKVTQLEQGATASSSGTAAPAGQAQEIAKAVIVALAEAGLLKGDGHYSLSKEESIKGLQVFKNDGAVTFR